MSNGNDNTAYIAWDDPRVEPEINGEDVLVSKVIGLVNSLQQQNFDVHRHAFRGTHVKTQAVVKGTLTIPDELPAHLKQGLFAQPGSHPAVLRYANEPSLIQDDRAPGPRGLGMRVFDVQGKHLDPIGDRTATMDFTFNNAPVLELRTLPTTAEIISLREKYLVHDQDKLEEKLKERDDTELQTAPMQLPNHHFMAYTMYSQSAYRYGKYVCKYALFPTTQLQKSLADSHKITSTSDSTQHSEWLKDYFAHHDAEYDFRVQLFSDPEAQSVEDCSVEWNEERFPFETVARLVIPKGQDAFSAARRTFWEEKMKLNVWYNLEEHRPLGSTNRLRKELYKASAKKRADVNSTKLLDVDDIAMIP